MGDHRCRNLRAGTQPTRRCFVLGSGAVLGSAALVGCGGDEEPSSEPTRATGDDGTLVALSDVPVGGAVLVEGPGGPLIVAQPTEASAASPELPGGR